jgi:phosphoribosylanthranilate isomerase
MQGGSGQAVSYEKVKTLIRQYPCFLAGGLTVSRVFHLINTYQPYGLDVSSNVENQYGDKDRKKVYAFITAVKKRGLYENQLSK